jgi:serine protease Do
MPTPSPTTLRDAARAALVAADRSVVRIGRAPGRGCGVVVGDGFVLTNAHNLRDRTTEVTFAGGRATQGEVVGVDPDGDLVVLAVATEDAPVLAWSEATVEAGDVVFAIGRSGDGGARLTHGLVSGVERAFRGPRGRQITGSVEHTAPLARGSSGSPIVDEHGLLVGLNTARLADGFYLALPADAALRERVDALVRGESARRLVLGVGLAPADVAAQLRASVGLPERAGLLVRSVADASPAATAGIKVGDLVVQADDRAITTVDDLHAAMDAARAAGALTVTVVRGNDEHTVAVSFGTSAPEG